MSRQRTYSLASFDLNLLVAFDAMMQERSVSRAASEIGISQPGMSNALRRLREIFNDELFVRSSEGMVPSGTALMLAEMIRPGLSQIREGIQQNIAFDPARTTRRFVIGTTDGGSMLGLPRFARWLLAECPKASLQVVDIGAGDLVDRLLAEEMDLAISAPEISHPAITYRMVMTFPYVVIVDGGSEVARSGALTVEDIARLPHVTFTASPIEQQLDGLLAERGLTRRVAVSIPHLWAIPSMVAGSNMIAILEAGVVQTSPHRQNVAVYDDPLGLPPSRAGLAWNARHDNDPGHRWLRERILALAHLA
jgi:DNA-binding transcriptional LysR family regulator